MLKNKEYLAKGKRSVVYKGLYQGKSAVMKIAKKGSPPNIIKNETRWLKKLEKYAIGPKLYSEGKDYMICEFLEGKRIMDWLEEHNKKEILQAIRVVLKQCMILDKLEVNKKELQRPTKHIIIGKKIKMIDFERCKQTKSPKNVTQFCQFLTSSNMKKLLDKKNIHIDKKKVINILKDYKKEQNEKNFKKILNYITYYKGTLIQ